MTSFVILHLDNVHFSDVVLNSNALIFERTPSGYNCPETPLAVTATRPDGTEEIVLTAQSVYGLSTIQITDCGIAALAFDIIEHMGSYPAWFLEMCQSRFGDRAKEFVRRKVWANMKPYYPANV